MEKVEEILEDALKHLVLAETITRSLGLRTVARQILNKEYELVEENYIKVNLPTTNAKFESGSGEGCWAVPYKPLDLDICNLDAAGTLFEVVLLNDAVCFPFPYGTILSVECRGGDFRPILDRGWITSTILTSTKGAISFDEMLEA